MENKKITWLSLLLFAAGLLFFTPVYSQQDQINACRSALQKTIPDSSRIQTLCDLAALLSINSDTTEAYKLLNDALSLSKKTGDNYSLAYVYSKTGEYYMRISAYDKSDNYFHQAYNLYAKENTEKGKLGLASSMENLSTISSRKGDYKNAIELKLKALDIWQASNAPEKVEAIGNIYGGIAILYIDHDQVDKAIYYDKKGIESRIQYNKIDHDLATSYIYLADDFISNNQTDSAKKYMAVAKVLADSLKIPLLYMQYYSFYAKIFLQEKDYAQSLKYSMQAHDYAVEVRNSVSEMVSDYNIARSYKGLGEPEKAIPYLEQHLAIATKVQSIKEQQVALLELSTDENMLGNNDKAYNYLNRYMILKDSSNKDEEKIKLNDIDNKYQNAEKEKQIILLESQKKEQTILITSLTAGMVVLLIIAFLTYRNISNRKKIAEQQVKQLEQDKQLLAVNSILQGQEAERRRMAKDLHDGLGGMLSGIKLNLSSMKGNMIIGETDAQLFTKSIAQLDNAIAEMRRVAHNMMPEALLKFGLGEAIQDYCDGINESNTVKMKYTQLGMEQPLEKPTEVILYRIAQELSNNAIKHAAAKNIFIQLTKHERGITLTVEDDGKGFDTSQLPTIKGAGLQNVQSRVDYLKGSCEIQSLPGNGTSVIIEIPHYHG